MYSVATNRYDGSITIVQISNNELVRSLKYQQAPNHMAWIHECCITENFIILLTVRGSSPNRRAAARSAAVRSAAVRAAPVRAAAVRPSGACA